jgi:mono/diheme cytochrome c family protein
VALLVAGMALVGMVAARGAAGAEEPAAAHPGLAVYRQHCQRCHGPAGEGTTEVPAPLVGERSVDQLATLIDHTMPEDDPDAVDAPAARAVAEYVHEAFYSPLARARNRPARVELSRLTVRQHLHAIADLVGSLSGDLPSLGTERGLSGSYHKGRSFDRRQRVFTRLDPEVRFNFGTEGPDPESFEPGRFAIRWSGSVVPPDTGIHEFVVRTEHAVRLYVNQRGDADPPLIDAWVKSGTDSEFRGRAMLLGGRPHGLVLEFSKANQGVDNPAREQPTQATVELLWRRPGGLLETVPARCLIPVEAPPTLVLSTPFPPDDRSTGYDRGTGVSKEWLSAATAAAIETADHVAADVDRLTRVPREAPDRPARLQAFAATFAGRAFGRPLDDGLRRLVVERPSADVDADAGLRRSLLAILVSPRFLFRTDGVGTGADPAADAHRVAGRLALGLWDSIPDRQLLEAAERGHLATPDQIRAQAERMLVDPRGRAKLRDMLVAWLRLDQVGELVKDPTLHPDFSPEVVADLRTSLEIQLDDVLWGGPTADFRRLFTDDHLPLNGRLAPLYGVDLPAAAGFRRVRPDDGQRAGVLTHPFVLSVLAYRSATSPIHRGVFLARGVLGNVLKPPQEAIAPLAPDLHPGLSTRQRVELQTSPAQCQTCHALVNPLGFSLEAFDAIGRHRPTVTIDGAAVPVDDRGSYQPRHGDAVAFRGARELAAMVADSDDAREAFVRSLFHALVRQPVRAFGPDLQATLETAFREQGHDIRRLAVDIMVATAAGPPASAAVAGPPGATTP